MTVAQWIFHYFEIMKFKKEDTEISLDVVKAALVTITEDIELLGMVIDKDKGSSMIEVKSKMREKSKTNTENNESNKNNENVDNNPMSSEDQELLDFFNSAPLEMKASKTQSDIGKFFLPTVDIKKMKLGFESADNKESIEEDNSKQEIINFENIPKLEIVKNANDTIKPELGF